MTLTSLGLDISDSTPALRALNLWKQVSRHVAADNTQDLPEVRDGLLGEIIVLASQIQTVDNTRQAMTVDGVGMEGNNIPLHQKITPAALEAMLADPTLATPGVVYKVEDNDGTIEALKLYTLDNGALKPIGGSALDSAKAQAASDTANEALATAQEALDQINNAQVGDALTLDGASKDEIIAEALAQIPPFSDAVDSDSSTTGASSKAVKTVNDAKQDKITATGTDKLLTAPEQEGGQPGTLPAGGVSLPGSSYIDVALPANNGTYNAPADGWLAVGKAVTAAGQFLGLHSSPGAVARVYAYSSGQELYVSIPCRKDTLCTFAYNAAGATVYSRFIYAGGG
jgi:hypothetical protein